MIIMAILAPVLIMAMILAGAATIAVAVVSVSAVGGIVFGVSDRVFHAVAAKRGARRREVPDNVVAWPHPTAQPEFADLRVWNTELVGFDRWAPQTPVERELVPVSCAASSGDDWEQVVGFEPWEEAVPFKEPDFEQVVTYTLVAGSDF
jgi:hypothetical protein